MELEIILKKVVKIVSILLIIFFLVRAVNYFDYLRKFQSLPTINPHFLLGDLPKWWKERGKYIMSIIIYQIFSNMINTSIGIFSQMMNFLKKS